jgi:hypothetical protein
MGRAMDFERANKLAVLGIVGPEGYLVLDHEGYARLLRERSGRL